MGKKVRFHLVFMQIYFSQINALLIAITRVPLPDDKSLTKEDLDKLSSTLLLLVAITLDHEINGLLATLETLIVDSIYKLDLKRPKKSMTRKGMLNIDMIKILSEIEDHTLLGVNREKYFALLMNQVYAYKGVDLEDEDLDNIINNIFVKE